MTNLAASFDKFYDAIALGALPEERIERACERLEDHLVEHCDVPREAIFLQGSYANDTSIRPARPDGEYDLDVVAVIAGPEMTVDEAFTYLEETLERDGDYAERIEKDRAPCVRLRYASDEQGGFHVDIVAARPANDAPLEIPIRDVGWKPTNPKGYTDWCDSQPDQFRRTVRMLKRWRDEHEDDRRGVKSIVLQVLTGNFLPTTTDDAEALQGTLVALRSHLAGYAETPPVVANPALPSENLTRTWPAEHYKMFRHHVSDAADLATRALQSGDIDESHVLWRQLLGESFPPPPERPVRDKVVPPVPPPGHHATPTRGPQRERYG